VDINLKYRPEIDGLRALAVVPVILFHAGFELFSGGFVGVDVFFVISGYLITTILIEDIENKSFSIVNFYERRARRILPALFFVMLVCIPFAWKWMMPSQMKDFSQSLVAVSLFASNILFWRETGYFDAAAEEKPLLHTWSLAVEEQYYVLFPIFLILAWRFGKNRVFWMIVAMAAISLLLSEWGWRNKATANFYLAPTRAWELFAGSIAAFIVQKNGVQKNNFLGLLGLAVIIFSIFAYDETTPFPSVYALVPVVGVVLLILYADKDTLASKFLSSEGFVGIGLISYSAYLWHQPLFAFARIRSLEQPSVSLMLGLTTASLTLAYLSWRYIEKPFRVKGIITRKPIFNISIAGIIAFILFGINGHFKEGFPSRVAQSELPYHTFSDSKGNCMNRVRDFCNIKDDRKKIFVIGDSTIQPLATSLNALQQQFAVVPITAEGCILVEGYALYDTELRGFQESCLSKKFEEVLSLIERVKPNLVIYGGMFNKAISGNSIQKNGRLKAWQNEFKSYNSAVSLSDAIAETVKKLSQISDNVLLVEFPQTGMNAQELLFKHLLFDTEIVDMYLPLNALLDWHKDGALLLSDISKIDNVSVLSVMDVLCENSLCSIIIDGKPMYTDMTHPSNHYTDILVQRILDEMQLNTGAAY
jgi:peptidoglycan/LPS O-acetylase OafA/YrhL